MGGGGEREEGGGGGGGGVVVWWCGGVVVWCVRWCGQVHVTLEGWQGILDKDFIIRLFRRKVIPHQVIVWTRKPERLRCTMNSCRSALVVLDTKEAEMHDDSRRRNTVGTQKALDNRTRTEQGTRPSGSEV